MAHKVVMVHTCSPACFHACLSLLQHFPLLLNQACVSVRTRKHKIVDSSGHESISQAEINVRIFVRETTKWMVKELAQQHQCTNILYQHTDFDTT